MTEQIPKLDVKTLEYVCKMIEKDYEHHRKVMEKTTLEMGVIIHQVCARALDKVDRDIYYLIDEIKKEQEA